MFERKMLHPSIMLANRVVGLRLMKLMVGGRRARREARLIGRRKDRCCIHG